MKTRSILLLSGGVDSAVLLADRLHNEGDVPYCLFFDYGQKTARQERQAAMTLIGWYAREGVHGRTLQLSDALLHGSALTGQGDVPKDGHFADDRQKATYVPARNLVFISLAVAEAQRRGATEVLIGSHLGGEAVYRDNTPQFLLPLSKAASWAYGVGVSAPFQGISKADILVKARRLGVPLNLTWSCYEDGPSQCGRCGACLHLAEARRTADGLTAVPPSV